MTSSKRPVSRLRKPAARSPVQMLARTTGSSRIRSYVFCTFFPSEHGDQPPFARKKAFALYITGRRLTKPPWYHLNWTHTRPTLIERQHALTRITVGQPAKPTDPDADVQSAARGLPSEAPAQRAPSFHASLCAADFSVLLPVIALTVFMDTV